MALNVTFDGFIYDEDGALCSGTCNYQAYFRKVNGGSSTSKWNTVRTTEDGASAGYYSLNLGDGDFLTQNGNASSGDDVIIVFWSPETANRMDDCGPLTQWAAIKIDLGVGPGMSSSDVYTNAIEINRNWCPNLVWSMTTTADVYDTVTATNSSNDTHQWNYNSATMWQRDVLYTTIQDVNHIINTDYDWDDGNQDIDLTGVSNGSHFWTTSGDYTVEIVIEDECGCTVTGTKPIRIYWRSPTCGILCNEATGQNIDDPDTSVTFEFDGTDLDDAITSIDWHIHDSGAYGNTDTIITGAAPTDLITHTNGTGTDWYGNAGTAGAFTNPGNHLIEITIHWNDGFNSQELACSETFVQGYFSGPTVSFDQDPVEATVNSTVTFTNTSTDSESRVGTGLPDGTKYSWEYKSNGISVSDVDDVAYSYEFNIVPTTAVSGTVELCAEWSDGWNTHTTCTEEFIRFTALVTVTEEDCYYNLQVDGTSSDGSIDGYSWEVYASQTTTSGGPWSLLWTSPTGIAQQEKDIFFTAQGFYKAIGYVHGTGTTTYDDEIFYVSDPCVSGTDVECFEIIWNGTGIDDDGGDWIHTGDGEEKAEAKYAGTNGLHVYELNSDVCFESPTMIDIKNYNMLSMWIKPISWRPDKEINLELSPAGSAVLNLSTYLRPERVGEWQQVVVPLEHFHLTGWNDPVAPTYVNKLCFYCNCDIEYYLDDVMFSIGAAVYVGGGVCPPGMVAAPTYDATAPKISASPAQKHTRAFPPPNLDARRKYVP